jgi:hypothetical protein
MIGTTRPVLVALNLAKTPKIFSTNFCRNLNERSDSSLESRLFEGHPTPELGLSKRAFFDSADRPDASSLRAETGESAKQRSLAMSPARRSWRSIKREYARAFPHHVALPNAGGWRDHFISHALRSLTHESYRWWTESDCGVWGFKSAGNAVAFELWATSSGIDWGVVPGEQSEQPPRPPEADPNYGPTAPRMSKD